MTIFRSLSAQRCASARVCAFAVVALLSAILFSAIPASSQSKAITTSRNLAQLVSESQQVVQGWVTSVNLQPHAQLHNLLTVVVAIQVEDTLKGDAAKTFTFTQVVIDKVDQRQTMGYRVGQHLLLLLIKPSVYGLSSPAGMEQGRFRIQTTSDGKLLATNGLANAGLFRGLDSELQAKGIKPAPEAQTMIAKGAVGALPLEQLKSLIRAMSGTGATSPTK